MVALDPAFLLTTYKEMSHAGSPKKGDDRHRLVGHGIITVSCLLGIRKTASNFLVLMST